jgi:predicted patatin/cPLA2 family phospholipase
MQLSARLLTAENAAGTPLIQNIKKRLETNSTDRTDIKTALVIGAGAMRGVFSGGVVTALEELGLSEVFDEVIGISAGAATAAYFLSGQAKLGTSIYYEELASKDFINPLRPRNILNIGYLKEVFTEKKPLNIAAIEQNRSNFRIGVTDVDSVKPVYIQANHAKDMDIIKLIQASSAVPGLAQPIEINGILYSDGIATCKNPIGYAVEQLGCTDILYIANQALKENAARSLGHKVISQLLTTRHSADYRKAYQNRHVAADVLANTTYPEHLNIGVLYPENTTVGYLTTNKKRLKSVAEAATEQTLNLFKAS